jgi:hypothetical protein
MGEGGVLLAATVTRCSMNELDADLTWTLNGSNERLRGVVRFTPQNDGGPLVPREIQPVLFEWPCIEGCIADARQALIPVVEQCELAANASATALNVPPVTRSSCVGVTWLAGGGDPSWCTQKVSLGESIYHWSNWTWRNQTLQRFRIVMQPGGGSIVSDQRSSALSEQDLVSWQERLAPIWQMTAHAAESCRDGGSEVIRAVQADRWKVVARSCKPILGARVFEPYVR